MEAFLPERRHGFVKHAFSALRLQHLEVIDLRARPFSASADVAAVVDEAVTEAVGGAVESC